MAQLYECTNHNFVENTFDIPKCELNANGEFKLQYLKYQPQEEFCSYCGAIRVPIYEDGEFVQYQMKSPVIRY